MAWWAVTTAAKHTGRGQAEEPGKTTYVESATEPAVPPGGSVRGPFETKPGAQEGTASLGPNVDIPNPLSGLAAIGAGIAKVTGYLSDLAMWRSLGWLLLGAVLLGMGIWLWLKQQGLAPKVPPVIPVPV